MIGALALLALGALVARAGERVVDWLVPRRLNYRLAAAFGRLAVRLAGSEAELQEADDALANILAPPDDSAEISPLAAIVPVLLRCLVGQLLRQRAARVVYRHTNSKGVMYYLNSKMATLQGGNTQTIYYFSKEERPETACFLPTDRTVNENPRNGFLFLTRTCDATLSSAETATATQPPALLALRSALRSARSFPLGEDVIASVVDADRYGGDQLFARARQIGLRRIDRQQRSGYLPSTTDAIAESIAELVLTDLGYTPFWHITKPGMHGVDLLFLGPDNRVLALEVKGTLHKGRIPRLKALRPPTDEPRVAQRRAQPGYGRMVAHCG